MKNNKSKYEKYIRKLLNDYKTVNRFSPFPYYDTELIEELEIKLKTIMQNKKEYYDSLPVACCKHCKELNLKTDELENDVCLRCGASGNDIAEIYDNIFDYSKKTGKKLE